jgi:hypothetical protein
MFVSVRSHGATHLTFAPQQTGRTALHTNRAQLVHPFVELRGTRGNLFRNVCRDFEVSPVPSQGQCTVSLGRLGTSLTNFSHSSHPKRRLEGEYIDGNSLHVRVNVC